MNRDKWEELDLTTDEIKSLTDALQKEEFRKLLVEYCEELNDPENRKKFEEELTQLEAERGIDITFINPEPGYVVKTTVDGQMKGFINVCQSGKVQRPVSEYRATSGERGLNWTLPHTQAPPRRDLDNKGAVCMVYDVVFHPDALHLAGKNSRFRDVLTDTACEAVESAFSVKLDRTNVKYPKIAFKGTPKPTVIRRKSDNAPVCEPSPIDAIYPPLKPQNGPSQVRVVPQSPKPGAYATPKYTIIHRKDVDYQEFTNELDAKINATVPKELVIVVDLPLLKSTENVSLDVTKRRVVLVSERPAKYKLDIQLPYEVAECQGGAKFDASTRRLSITLPVVKEHHLQLIDVTRQDSGVESMPQSPAVSPTGSNSDFDEVFEEKFLDDTISYTLPSFTCNTLDDIVAFTLNIKNVDPTSIITKQEDTLLRVKFSSIGGGFYPSHHSFSVKFPAGRITESSAEAWDNNLVLQCEMEDLQACDHYDVGLYLDNLKTYPLKFSTNSLAPKPPIEDDSLRIEVNSLATDEVEITVDPPECSSDSQLPEKIPQIPENSSEKKGKKKNRKPRSLSESSCDKIANKDTSEALEAERSVRKSRSMSESSGDEQNSPRFRFKGILKRSCSYNPSTSSSIDDHFSVSVDLGVGSFDGIPEEQELSESCKKTVRFSDVIRKQLFRSNSSILGRRLKNMKKRAKKRAQENRRMSESENSECEEKDKPSNSSMQRRDSGVEMCDGSTKVKFQGKKGGQPKKKCDNTADLEFKSGMIFNLEM
ncbi:protein kintoun [Phlebotomus papatasi]|uniref:Protein kintoun n=1 Tax=Phlebotomus papatasi TaxID=29031 RepID=A0A1B0D1H0_PHLPP|nr:protein kintoun [Phlebotomus papatasi]